jgi:sugar O-acyltransferase (sialic acid O-acetyltransferase NeuD family)
MLDVLRLERMEFENMLTRKESATSAGVVNTYAILGGGGHAREVIAFMRREGRVKICGIYDDNEALHGTIIDGVEVKGSMSAMPPFANWLICIGQNEIRKQINERLDPHDLGLAGQPYYPWNEVLVAETAVIGAGSFVGRGAFIGPGVSVGKHCIIQPGVHVGHDAVVGDYAFIGGRVIIGGGVEVGTGVVVGMNSVIAPQVKIGAWSNVMLSSGVIADIPPGMNCGGVPAIVFGKLDRTRIC